MSTAWIKEYYGASEYSQPTGVEPALVDQAPVTVSGTAASSAAFGANTHLVRLVADVGVSYAVGQSPTATANNSYLPANTIEYLVVQPGHKVSFITNS